MTYSQVELSLECAQGSITTCNSPQYSYDSRILAARPTSEKMRTLLQDPSSIVDYALSPDGKKLVYTSFVGNPADQKKEWRLSVHDFQSGTTRVLFSNHDGQSYYSPKWAPSGDMILYVTITLDEVQGKLTTAGWLNIVRPDGSSASKAVFAGDDRGAIPIGPAVTSDGQSIIFAIDQDVSGEGIDGPGIYRMTLAHAIPEFPVAGIVAVASIASVIAITTIRMRR